MSTDDTDSKASNIKLLKLVAQLLPDQSIAISRFERHYPNCQNTPNEQLACDEAIGQVLSWFYASIRAKDGIIKEKDERLSEKDRIIKEKDERLLEKDEVIKITRESADLVTELNERMKIDPRRKWGTYTRAQAWKRLNDDKRVNYELLIENENHALSSVLASNFANLDPASWEKEPDMYPPIIKAIKDGLYKNKDILVLDTSRNHDFSADISIASYDDGRLVYSLRYFLELKLPKVQPCTPEYRGQVVDYFHDVSEKQPHRTQFAAILSNVTSSWVYVASFDRQGIKINEYPCATLADAIIFVEKLPASKVKAQLPPLDNALGKSVSVLAAGKHSILLSVMKVHHSPRLQSLLAQGQAVENIPMWSEPKRHREQKGRFVLKIAHGDSSLSHEIRILEKLRNAPCPHVPEMVWTRGIRELGIVPIGEPVLPGEPPLISRKIVEGMIAGLKYLHGLCIIHRDIRLSNLILKRSGNDINVVIIDYETAFDGDPQMVDYTGGYICWPRRLLDTATELYTPQPSDDLFASILVILHLLFPSRFVEFKAGNIQAGADAPNKETSKVLRMWQDIEDSKIWGPFYRAAQQSDYDGMLWMADVFCHV